MPLVPLALVVLAAALHTAWNLLFKSSDRKEVFTWWALLCGTLAFLPLLIRGGPIPRSIWPYAAASAVFEVLYYTVLGRAYDRGDFSLVYPIARGAAPIFLAVWAFLFLGERPGPQGCAGLAVLMAGLAMVGRQPSSGPQGQSWRRRFGAAGLLEAIAVGVCISIYSAIDAAAVRRVQPAAYTVLVLGLTGILLTPVVVARHGTKGMLAEWRARRGAIVAVGTMTLLAYLLVLEAYARSSVAYAGAVREVSIVLAALAGWAVLHERLGASRLIGSLLAFAGVILIALAG
jgi:drug/metabolite transporter (DMT)-like permease